MTLPPPDETREKRYGHGTACSFCGKSSDEVNEIVKGPDVNICGKCVRLCYEIISEKELQNAQRKTDTSEGDSAEREATTTERAPPGVPDFQNLTLEEASAEFDRFGERYIEAFEQLTHHQRSVSVLEPRVVFYREIAKKLKRVIDGKNP